MSPPSCLSIVCQLVNWSSDMRFWIFVRLSPTTLDFRLKNWIIDSTHKFMGLLSDQYVTWINLQSAYFKSQISSNILVIDILFDSSLQSCNYQLPIADSCGVLHYYWERLLLYFLLFLRIIFNKKYFVPCFKLCPGKKCDRADRRSANLTCEI